MERWFLVYRAAREFAKPGAQQSMLERTVNKMFEEKQTPEQVEKYLVNVMADGINHGNWPWS